MKLEHVNALVKLRLEQARATLDDARFLFEGGRSSQSIINRAYYAMFYAALALLQTIGKVPAKHSGVLSLFDTEFVLKGLFPKDLSKDFHQAFDARQVSDYQPVQPASREQAEALLEKAARFILSVEQYLSETQRPEG